MCSRYDYTVKSVFNDIDLDNKGVLDINSIELFLSKFKMDTYDEEVVALMRRCDYDNDGLISLQDFTRAIDYEYAKLKKFREPKK